ncbi:hypothetical protein [Rhizobium croatiense]|uniref:hypothetical protein n=1 Tax=Rhizobium croatiense TaxID=2867516 RepID=UPI0023EC75AE|nr:hypothetical protein [Rhizobium croatiense]WET75260.1 hypothetical protein PYR68_07105 [Rhizobium croatiense]
MATFAVYHIETRAKECHSGFAKRLASGLLHFDPQAEPSAGLHDQSCKTSLAMFNSASEGGGNDALHRGWVVVSMRISSVRSGDHARDTDLISVTGVLNGGDEIVFRNVAAAPNKALVFLNSEGGDLKAGIEIARAIRLRFVRIRHS